MPRERPSDEPLVVIIVDLVVAIDRAEEFRRELGVTIDEVLATEPGCLRFEALRDSEDEERWLLVEEYRDARAFAQHQQGRALARWRAVVDARGLVRASTRRIMHAVGVHAR